MSPPSSVLHVMKRPCAQVLDAVRSSEVGLAFIASLVIGMTNAIFYALTRLTDGATALGLNELELRLAYRIDDVPGSSERKRDA
jgi:hypothetical protein